MDKTCISWLGDPVTRNNYKAVLLHTLKGPTAHVFVNVCGGTGWQQPLYATFLKARFLATGYVSASASHRFCGELVKEGSLHGLSGRLEMQPDGQNTVCMQHNGIKTGAI